MFILRKITEKGKGVELNFCLGKSCTIITKEANPSEFEKHALMHPEKCYGLMFGEDGTCLELYSSQVNYLMTESGKTFKKL